MARRIASNSVLKYDPDYAVPPGRTLLETIESLGLEQKELSQRTGYTEKHVSQIVRGKSPISPDAALRFEQVTGVPARVWNQLESHYQERLAKLEARKRDEGHLAWLDSFPYAELDKLDGTGVSGVTLDFSKTQILVIDFEWLGVGRVRIGFNIDGITYYCHEMLHANVLSDVYMSTPNLPLRFEVTNAGTGVASTLKAICCSVTTEGGLSSLGMVRYASTNGTHVDADVADTVYAVIGIRLKTAYIGQTITILRAALLCETADNFEWFLVINPTVAGVFTYAAETNSAVEVARGATANTVTGGTKIDGGFVNQIGSSGGGASTSITSDLRLGASIAGTVDTLVLCVRPLGANADIQGSITWQEVS